jgi:hypothetical protein
VKRIDKLTRKLVDHYAGKYVTQTERALLGVYVEIGIRKGMQLLRERHAISGACLDIDVENIEDELEQEDELI